MSVGAEAIRELGSRLRLFHGRIAHNAAHHLAVLADVLDGVPEDLAGRCCSRCGSGLVGGGGHMRRVDDGVYELFCLGCHIEHGE